MLPNPIISIGQLEIYMYGVCIAIGVVMAVVILRLYGKKLKVNPKLLDFVEIDAYFAIALGFLFSGLFQSVYNYIENPEAGFKYGGITFLGGLIGGAVTFFIIYFIFKKKRNLRFQDVMDIVPCSILIGHGFGRIGCFCSGCCYGIEVEAGHWYSWMGVHFPEVSGVVFPTQLFEAIFLFIMFGVLSVLCLKRKGRQNFSIYLITYGVFRYLIEYIRGDERGEFIPGMSPSQFWSIIMVALGIVMIFFTKYVLFSEKKKVVTGDAVIEDRFALETATEVKVEEENKEVVKEENKEEKEAPKKKTTTKKAQTKKPTSKKSTSTTKKTTTKKTTSPKKATPKKVEPKEEPVKEEKEILEKKTNPFENKHLTSEESANEASEKDVAIEIDGEVVDDKHMDRMRKVLLAQKKLREEGQSEGSKKSVSLEEKLGNKKK